MILPALGAVVILILGYNFPKQTAYLVLFIIGIIVSIYMYEKSSEKADEKFKDLISIDVSYNISHCSIEKPISVIIKNESNKIVNSVSWSFKAHKPGHSDNLAPYSYGPSYKSDKILNENEDVNLCYKSPRLARDNTPATVNWVITDKVVVFEN